MESKDMWSDSQIAAMEMTQKDRDIIAALKSPSNIWLKANDYSQAEEDLYSYAGYYMFPEVYHKQKQMDIYVQYEERPNGYGYLDQLLFPGGILVTDKKKIDMSSAIVFNKKAQTVTTGTCRLDIELLHIINARAKELGFSCRNKENIVLHKLKIMERNPEFGLSLTEDDISVMKKICMEQAGEYR